MLHLIEDLLQDNLATRLGDPGRQLRIVVLTGVDDQCVGAEQIDDRGELDQLGAGAQHDGYLAAHRGSPEQVAALAGEVTVGGHEQAQVELVGAQVIGDQLGALQSALGVGHALGRAGGIPGGGAGAGVVGEVQGVGEIQFDESGDLGVGERDVGEFDVQWQQVPVLELPLDVVRGQGLSISVTGCPRGEVTSRCAEPGNRACPVGTSSGRIDGRRASLDTTATAR